jgi:hypothetical protein
MMLGLNMTMGTKTAESILVSSVLLMARRPKFQQGCVYTHSIFRMEGTLWAVVFILS